MQFEKPSFARFGGNANPVSVTAEKLAENSGEASVNNMGVDKDNRMPKTAMWLDVVISISLVALFFGLPLFFTGLTFQGISFEKQIYFYFWLLVGIVAWTSKSVVVGEMRIRRTPLDIPIGLFWLFYVLAAFFSVDRWHSFWGFFGDPSRGVISVTALVLVYYFLLSHFTPKRFYLMFWSFVLSGFLVIVWTLLVTMEIRFLPTVWERYAPMSLIGTISTLGVFLGFLAPLFLTALFMLWKSDSLKKISRLVLTVLIFMGLVADLFLLLALYPFVVWIVILGGLSFFMVYILAQIVRPPEQWTWVPMIAFVLVLIFLMVGKISIVRDNLLPVEVMPGRSLSWQISKNAVKENFFTGVGPANYGYAFSMFRPEEYNLHALYTLRFYQGVGLFFEALPTIGAIGTVLFVLLWLSYISVALYLLTREKQRNKVYSLGLLTVAVMFFLANFVSAINGSLLIIGALLASLALGVLLWESGSEKRYLQLSFKAAPKFALSLAFIFMVVSAGVAFVFVFMGKVFIADVYAGKASRLSASGPNRDSIALLERSALAYPQEGRYYTRLGQEYMALANSEAGKTEGERNVDAIRFYVNQAVAASEQGKSLMPNDAMAVESLSLIYENASLYAGDALSKAEESYNRALELEPKNPLYFLKLGQIKKSSGDAKPEGQERDDFYKEASDFFQKSIDAKENLAVAHHNLSVTLSRLKEMDRAIESAQKTLLIENNNQSYKYNLGALYQLRDADGDKDRAEEIFKNILTVNDKLIDVRLSLGFLYEAQNKNDAAIAEYRKLLDILSDSSGDNIEQTRDQIRKFIENVQNGTGNLPKKNTASVPPVETTPETPEVTEVTETVEATEAPETPAPAVPAGPNVSPLAPTGQ